MQASLYMVLQAKKLLDAQAGHLDMQLDEVATIISKAELEVLQVQAVQANLMQSLSNSKPARRYQLPSASSSCTRKRG